MGSKEFHAAVHAFAITHQHLAERTTIDSLNKEMPNWDKIVSDKFILFAANRGVFENEDDYGVVEHRPGRHVVRVGRDYVDWAIRRHEPKAVWPGFWTDKVE